MEGRLYLGSSQVSIPPNGTEIVKLTVNADKGTLPGSYLKINLKVSIQACPQDGDLWIYASVLDSTPYPDDNFSVSDPFFGEAIFALEDLGSAVLWRGLAPIFGGLLGSLNEPVTYIETPDLTPIGKGSIKDYPYLIVPSCGFWGIEGSSFFKALIDDYISSGGTLIVFSQQYGYELSALPGGKVYGYGYSEDQGCHNNAVYIENYHPIFAGQEGVNLDLNVDGYFTQWPEEATILLRRTKNHMPAMIAYPYGEGQVIASTLYPDWGYGYSQQTEAERRLVMDLINWAKDPGEILEFRPGDTVNLQLAISNDQLAMAEKVEIRIYDPDGNRIASDTQELTPSLEPDQSTTIPFSYNSSSSSALGIYRVTYILLDEADNEIQEEKRGERFAVSYTFANTNPLPGLAFAVTSPTENLLSGCKVTFMIHIWNNGDEDKEITVDCQWKPNEISPVDTFTVPAHSSLSIPYTIDNMSYWSSWYWNAWRFTAYFYDENGTRLGESFLTGNLFYPSVDVGLLTDKDIYYRGENVNIALDLKNRKDVSYDAEVDLIVLDPNNAKVYEKEMDVNLEPEGSEEMELSFILPDDSVGGIYIIRAETYKDGSKIGYGSSYFEFPKLLASLNVILPDAFMPNADNTVSFEVKNLGYTDISSGALSVTLKDPDGDTVWSQTSTFGIISIDGSIILNVDIPIPQEIKFGTYRLSYALTYGDKSLAGEDEIPCSAIIKDPEFDKSSYRVREEMGIEVEVINNGRFREDLDVILSIPDVGFEETRSILELMPNDTASLIYTIGIPEDLEPGIHDVIVSCQLSVDSNKTKTFKFVVPESKLELSLEKTDYLAGQVGSITVRNTGGVDTDYDYTISLLQGENKVADFTGTGSVQAGDSSTINFSIPNRIVEGEYRLISEVEDKETGKSVRLEKTIKVSGLLKLILEKTDYSAGEEIEVGLKNIGVQEKSFNYTIRLVDWYEREFSRELGTETIGPSDSKTISLTILGQAVKGQYQLIVECEDIVWEDSITFERPINVAGLKTDLTVITDKEAYFISEPITAIARIDNQDGQIENGTLSLKITTVLEGWTNYPEIKDVVAIAVDKNEVWIGTSNRGVYYYLSLEDRWVEFSDWDYIGAIGIDSDYIWIGYTDTYYYGVERYNRVTGNREGHYLWPIQIIAIAVDDRYVWCGTNGSGLYGYDKQDGSWSPYTTENSGLTDNYVSSLAIDGDYLWVGHMSWSGDLKVSRYHKPTDTWQQYTIAEDSMDFQEISSIAVDDDSVWIGSSGEMEHDLHRYNKKDESWTTYTTENSGLVSNNVTSIAVEGDYVWIGTDKGVSRYNKQDDFWITYNTENSELISDNVTYITVDSNSVWIGTREGVSRYQKRGGLIWKKNFPVNLPESGDVEISEEVGTLGVTGKFYLVGELYSATEQLITQDEYGFYISPGTVTLTLTTDKRSYRTGEPIRINGEVTNWADIPTDELTLQINTGTITIYTETLSLAPGDTHTFTTTATSYESFLLSGIVSSPAIGTITVSEQITIEPLLLEVVIDCPEVVGRGTNTFRVNLNNVGNTDVVVDYKLDIGGDTKDYGTIGILAGKTEVIEDEFNILDDDTITVTLSGDVAGTWTRSFEFGEKVDLEVLPEEVYPVGYQEIPFRLSNSGKMDSLFEVIFSLRPEAASQTFSSPGLFKAPSPSSTGPENQDILPAWCKEIPKINLKPSVFKAPGLQSSVPSIQDQTSVINSRAPRVTYSQDSIIMTKTFYLPAGKSIEGSLVYELEAGTYQLGYEYFRGTGSALFRVAENNKSQITDVRSQKTEERLEIGIEVENLGANEFAGGLRLNAGFFEEERDLRLGIGEARGETFSLTPNVAMGTYTAAAQILYNGNVISERSGDFVLEPDFEIITYNLQPTTFSIGEGSTFTFVVKNTGSAGGQVEIGLDFDALDFEEVKTLWLGSGKTETVSFTGFVPDDLEDKAYRAVVSNRWLVVSGEKKEEQDIWVHINGIKIEVEAGLDNALYTEAETAILTLRITNQSATELGILNMYKKVKFNEYEEAKDFEIGPNNQEIVTFEIPVRFTEEKIFYEIYAQSGRAIYLNSIYIYEKGEIISLYTDKQVYSAGEEVTVTVESSETGTLTLSGPEWSGSFPLDTGSWTTTFSLPQDLNSGTYYLTYQLTSDSQPIAGEYPFDVIGYLARILECRLDKKSYGPEDEMEVKLRIDVNRNIYGVLKGWICNPMDEYTELFEYPDTFTQGENTLSLASTFSTAYAGVHRLVYGLYYQDLMLASGGEDFDVGGIILTTLSTDKTEYLNALGPVELTIGIIGIDGTGTLRIEVDTGLVSEETVSGDGYFELNKSLWMESYDTHTISCALIDSAGVVSKKEATIVMVATPPVANAGDSVNMCSESCISLNGSVTGGIPPYTYSWTPSAGLDYPDSPTPNACPDTSTTYTLMVTDANGWTDTDEVVVEISPSPVVEAGDSVSIYPGTCITLSGSVSGGSPPYTYAWSPSIGLDYPDSPTPDACPDTTTTYTLTVTDINGCLDGTEVIVIVNPQLEMTIDIDPNTLNLKSKGKWITCYIELPSGYDVGDIDISKLKISKIGNTDIVPIFSESAPTEIGDHDKDGIADLMTKFNRSLLQDIVPAQDAVKITVEGELKGGTGLIGHDTIRVINPDGTKEGEARSSDGKTKIKFSQGVIRENDWVIISKPTGNSPSDPVGYCRIGDSIVKIEIYNDSGDLITDFNPLATLVLHYPDADPEDGIVDGTSPGLDEMSLRIYTIEGGVWEEVFGSIVDPVENTVSATLAQFSVYSLMGQVAPADHLGQVIVYPNPFKPYKGHERIYFGHPDDSTKRLTREATIKIYDIAGELVRTIKEVDGDGEATWDATNEKGKDVASGIYIYYIRNPEGGKCVGKIGIIR